MKNPLRECPGKGDKARSCHNPKFRKNYDGINWNDRKTVEARIIKKYENWVTSVIKKKKK